MREFTGAETPGLGESGPGTFGGTLEGLAVDPVSGHLLVAVTSERGGGEVGAVDEFDIAAGNFVAQVTGVGGVPFGNVTGVAADSVGDVYALDSARGVVVELGKGAYAPSVTLGRALGRTATGAVLTGLVNPAQHGNLPEPAPVTECEFQFVSEDAFMEAESKKEEGFAHAEAAGCVPEASKIVPVEPEANHEVKAAIGGLTAGKTYRYRLVAATEAAKNGGQSVSEELAFTAPAAPRILSTTADNVSSRFADFHAQIDPEGADTSFQFEYMPASAFAANGNAWSGPDAASRAPATPEDIGSGGPSGGAVENVVTRVGGLAPDTVYDFRVRASNECEPGARCVSAGEHASKGEEVTRSFVTAPAASVGLPDHRAYELVTPPDKLGRGDLFDGLQRNGNFFSTDLGVPAENGMGFFLETFAAFGPAAAAGHGAYAFKRDPGTGWGYTSLTGPSLGVQSLTEVIFDASDLSKVGVNDSVGVAPESEGGRNVELLGAPGGPYTQLAVGPTVHTLTEAQAERTQIVGASADLGRVVVESQSNTLCPGAETTKHGGVLCEWEGAYETGESGEPRPELRLVDVGAECGAAIGASAFGLFKGGSGYRAVSADGSRVFFTAPDPSATKKTAKKGAGTTAKWRRRTRRSCMCGSVRRRRSRCPSRNRGSRKKSQGKNTRR